MKSKILAIIMVCAVVFAVCISASAAEPAKVRIYTEEASGSYYVNQEMGGRQKIELTDIISANVEITDAYDAEVCSGLIYIKYNSAEVNCLGYKSVTGGSWEVNDSVDGVLRMAFSKSDAIDDGVVFAAAFELKEGVTETTFSLEIGELLTGDVVDGDVPAEYMITTEQATYKEGTQPPVVELLMGDANVDGKVDTQDATVILKHSAGMLTLEGRGFTQGDVNYDGKVNTADAVLVLKYAAGMITGF